MSTQHYSAVAVVTSLAVASKNSTAERPIVELPLKVTTTSSNGTSYDFHFVGVLWNDNAQMALKFGPGTTVFVEGEARSPIAFDNPDGTVGAELQVGIYTCMAVEPSTKQYARMIVQGNIGREPVASYPKGLLGRMATKFSVAVNRQTRNGSTVVWFNVSAIDGRDEGSYQPATIAAKNLAKSDPVGIEGRPSVSVWRNAQTGKPMASLDLNAYRINLMGRRQTAASTIPTAVPSYVMPAIQTPAAVLEVDVPF